MSTAIFRVRLMRRYCIRRNFLYFIFISCAISFYRFYTVRCIIVLWKKFVWVKFASSLNCVWGYFASLRSISAWELSQFPRKGCFYDDTCYKKNEHLQSNERKAGVFFRPSSSCGFFVYDAGNAAFFDSCGWAFYNAHHVAGCVALRVAAALLCFALQIIWFVRGAVLAGTQFYLSVFRAPFAFLIA